MQVALYVRVSTARQVQTQTIEQQLERLQAHVHAQGWQLEARHIFRDDGYSGADLTRPALTRLREQAGRAEFEAVLLTAPDRLARLYVHQVCLIEELSQAGCQVLFVERPMSQDPHDQLLLQIRGAVAEYERSLIAERMRRGRLSKLADGQLLPWTQPPYGYRSDVFHPREPTSLQPDPITAAVVQEIFARYLADGATLYAVAQHLTATEVPTPRGAGSWAAGTVRTILTNETYAGTAYANRWLRVAAQRRRSSLQTVAVDDSLRARPREEWIAIAVPALVTREVFERVQAKLALNQKSAARHNTAHDYLLRALVSCGRCGRGTVGRFTAPGYAYYLCGGRLDTLRPKTERCHGRYIPVAALDELVWDDLCAVLTEPRHLRAALERAQHGDWWPHELQTRQATLATALAEGQQRLDRLIEAYTQGVIEVAELQRHREALLKQQAALLTQQRQLAAAAQHQLDLVAVAASLEAFCQQVRAGLTTATFEQRRRLVELLIDRVIVTDGEVEIRYVFPTSPSGSLTRFCHLRLNHLSAYLLSIRCAAALPS